MITQRFPIAQPTLYDVVQQVKDNIFSTLHVCMPAQVISFDGTKRTASIKILMKRVLPDGTLRDYQTLTQVPVLTAQGGNGSIQFPVSAGDQGIIIFADRNIGAWLQNGAVNPLPDMRMHDLSDGIFIPGLKALNSSAPAYPTDRIKLTYGTSEVDIKQSEVDLTGGGSTIALKAAEADLIAQSGGLVKIGNVTTTLMALLNILITAIEGIQVTGNIPLTAASIAALETARTDLETLLL